MEIKVAVDAGHGSNTIGKRTPDGYREHWINVRTAYYLARALERCGFSVIKTGWNDTNSKVDADTSLSARQKAIKNAGCKYSISCHANAYGSGWNDAQGIETLISNKSSAVKDSLKMAIKIHNRLIEGTTQKNRGVKTQSLSMCNCTAMGTEASVLVEIGFMTNHYEAQLMETDEFTKECGEEIAHGFCDYLNVGYIPDRGDAPVDSYVYSEAQGYGMEKARHFIRSYGGGTPIDDFKKLKTQVLQTAINLDYKAGLDLDGKFGPKSNNGLGTHYVAKGEKQYMVTAAEILMYMNDIDPDGVEFPGNYGNGLTKAAKQKFGGLGTKITAAQFKELIL